MALAPNAPPMKRASTRTLDGEIPSSAATVSCTALMPWHESCSVSWPPSHTAVVVSISSGLWWLAANRNGAATRTWAAASPAPASPRAVRPGIRPPKILSAS